MKKKNVFTKILDIVIDVIIALVFVVSLGVIIANVSAGENGNPNLFGYSLYTVQTDSMKGTIEEGDLILGKMVSYDDEVNEGDVITFKMTVAGQTILNTHKVVEKKFTGSQYEYYTQGTNTPDKDTGYRTIDTIVAKYTGFRIPGLGSFVDFIRQPAGFVLCLVTPMVLFVAYEVYKIVVMYMRGKKEEILSEAKEQTSDELKNAIIEEYLKSQEKAKAEGNSEKTEK